MLSMMSAMNELQKALGIKLKIKSVDVSALSENIENPVVFTFELDMISIHTAGR